MCEAVLNVCGGCLAIYHYLRVATYVNNCAMKLHGMFERGPSIATSIAVLLAI